MILKLFILKFADFMPNFDPEKKYLQKTNQTQTCLNNRFFCDFFLFIFRINYIENILVKANCTCQNNTVPKYGTHGQP